MERRVISRRRVLSLLPQAAGAWAAAGLVWPGIGRAAGVRASARSDVPGTVRFAVLADLHYGLAPDAGERLQTIIDAITAKRAALAAAPAREAQRGGSNAEGSDLDLVIQLGDFCHAGQDHGPCTGAYAGIDLPRHHVLGNHDMDTCTKAAAVEAFGMEHRHYEFVANGWRFVVCDLNHIREGERRLDYDTGNYYLDGAVISWMDLDQLAWLERVIAGSAEPVVLISHQPIAGFGPLMDSQREIVEAVKRGNAAARAAGHSGVVLLMCGHLHVDVLDDTEIGPSLCVNSASYHWSQGMVPYATALHTFITLGSDGRLEVEACAGSWADGAEVGKVPADRRGAVPWIEGKEREVLG